MRDKLGHFIKGHKEGVGNTWGYSKGQLPWNTGLKGVSTGAKDTKHWNWSGESVGYSGVHKWVRKKYKKPDLCEKCGTKSPKDLANKSGFYLRGLADWWYLCRSCHMAVDGHSEKAMKSQGWIDHQKNIKRDYFGRFQQ